jgi:hypothetical protein
MPDCMIVTLVFQSFLSERQRIPPLKAALRSEARY